MSRWICIDNICIPSDENDWDELVAFADAVAEQEPIDLVRCGECKKWFEYKGLNFCHRTRYTAKADDFCSYGERKESEEMPKGHIDCYKCRHSHKLYDFTGRATGAVFCSMRNGKLKKRFRKECKWKENE